ncbi:MAG: sensor histidine kinase [Phycisphaerales bacterium JB039]
MIAEPASAVPIDSGHDAAVRRRPRVLAQMRIRKKLLVLHTLFSLTLAVILILALRPAIGSVVRAAEQDKALATLRAVAAGAAPPQDVRLEPAGPGDMAELAAILEPGTPVLLGATSAGARAAMRLPDGSVQVATARSASARAQVLRLYGLLVVSLLAVYGLIAVSLELFVLPQHVYGPIRRLLQADQAVQEGRRDEELIDERDIASDELGEIMRSRNHAIRSIRRHERDLADALSRLEAVATDLRRKNHLLENARRNLAESDRLASLGMMSAGISHELNTPLTVLKGLVEKLQAEPEHRARPEDAALMLRVVHRLERLGESLLDFARARPSVASPHELRPMVEEAMTLVRLDRELDTVQLVNQAPDRLVVECDGDRILQVLVNLIRNAADAFAAAGRATGVVTVGASTVRREHTDWVSVTISDNGPGIDSEIISTLFEPFVTTRLDSRGAGLGLAVSDGIIREHGGLLMARNRTDGSGAVFEILLPARAQARAQPG